ncbi:kynurenine 3-monooxygenase-like protein [Leptotrombidium deliense]|uniref:Kynurenine 3-monooxygenase-like protein n=1 Tax=Leptotrombidium deliense TaxID=299467 RepID=A0A443S9F6_9ACAR|nr:kynurenine 3-monooxygenase-like protein [Leptotrombidium deliense]
MSSVAVVGGGLVGSLLACILAKRGFTVSLYEMRDDIRTMEVVKGKSINLALSERGRSALRLLDLEDEVINKHSIPMQARLIHDKNGKRRPIPYGKQGQCIYSVGRRYLNEVLLNAAKEYSNLKIYFNHKLVSCNFDDGKLSFMCDGKLVTVSADIIIGADGAHSAVRREMIKRTPIDFSQTYIEHGYIELCIEATHENNFAMEVNYLHIWPRNTFMVIALPNQDKSYTVTLFMPFTQFQKLKSADDLINFFEYNFPDAVQLIGREKLIQDYFNSTPSALISVKCKPYNFGKRALLVGDAAHAMVPFFGQGMNCVSLKET